MMRALKDITEFCVSGRRYDPKNPYGISEIKKALAVIAKAQGKIEETVRPAAVAIAVFFRKSRRVV